LPHTISTSIRIDAEPERVWAILMDFAAYPAWNPFIVAIEGEARPGAGLTVRIGPPGREPQTFKPVVVTVDSPSAFIWRGSLPIPGLFTGEHSFRLTREGDSTSFHHAEHFSGLLVPVLKKMLARTEEGFHQMNSALKARAEARQ
jgi:hypothetical protein